jgi:hypothetical protein
MSNDIGDFIPNKTRVQTTDGALDGPGTVIATDEDACLVTVKFDNYKYPPYKPDEFDPDDLEIIEEDN